jgi:hypothetical protein
MNNTFEQTQLKLMKDFINYDKLVDELIASKDKEIIRLEIEISKYKECQEGLRRDKERIELERVNSNLGNVRCHIFVNPNKIYYDMTNPTSN